MLKTFKSLKELPTLTESHYGRQNIAIDAGSTETRGVIVATDDVVLSEVSHISGVQMCELLPIPSGYASIPLESKLGAPTKFDTIADKLEYVIIKDSGGDLGWTKQRILKGSLMEASARSVCKVTSSLLKVEQEQTYLNIIITVANMLLAKTITTGKAFRKVMPIDLTVALPFDDVHSVKSITTFKKNLAGVYRVRFPRIRVERVNENGEVVDEDGNPISISGKPAKKDPYFVKFDIKEDSINVVSEQKAVAEYYETAFADEIEQEVLTNGYKSNTVIIEVGGRNTAMIMNKQSGMDESRQMTFDDGGSGIIRGIRESAISTLGLSIVTEEQALQALTTGKMSYGGKTIDCVGLVNKAKQDFANILYKNFTQFLDNYNIMLTTIQRVVVSGRGFKSIERKVGDSTEIISPSIRTFFEDLLRRISSDVEVVSIGVDYPIPWGLITCRLSTGDQSNNYYDYDLDEDLDL